MRKRTRKTVIGKKRRSAPRTEAEISPDDKRPSIGPTRTIVMIGLMGAGKSVVGRRLANRLGVPFIDADTEIEKAAGCTVAEIFARFGEPAFRDGETKVISRLLEGPVCVLATGGGAFISEDTRRAVREHGLSVWLKADLDILVQRTAGRAHRPLLNQGNPRETLRALMEKRYPVYAEADVTVHIQDESPEGTCSRVLAAIERHLGHTFTETRA